MPGNFAGLIWSAVLILFFLITAYFFRKKEIFGDFSAEFARKIVHIGVSNWYFIYVAFFDNFIYPVAGLMFFAVVNLFFELNFGKRRSWGMVYYPVAVAVCIISTELWFGSKEAVGCALLGMGYGDGIAALAGKKWGKKLIPFSPGKTWLGSLVVFIVVFFTVTVLLHSELIPSIVISFCAVLAEAYTPYGLDNITLPFTIFILVGLLC